MTLPHGMYEAQQIDPVESPDNKDSRLEAKLASLERRIVKLEKAQRRTDERASAFQRFISGTERSISKIFNELNNKISRSD